MKRCPECEFLYENESTTCDMDGTALRYTVKLPTLPGLAQSIWDRWTIALLCGVVIGTVLVILYRATPQAFTSSAGQIKSVKNELPNELPGANQKPQLPESAPAEASVSPSAIDAYDSTPDSRDPFETQSTTSGTKAQRLNRSSSAADQKEPLPASVIHFEPASSPQTVSTSTSGKAVLTATSAGETSANQASSQTSTPSANSASIHPRPPDRTTNKANSQNEKKDSGVKSLFKKAGKILKKPFGEN
jgi:hypothetical protein